MANAPRTPQAGGFILAVALIAGVIIGMARGQASAGFVGGLAVGLAGLLIVWLVDRRRG